MSQFCPCKLVFASGLQGPFLPFYHSFSLCSQAMTLLALSSHKSLQDLWLWSLTLNSLYFSKSGYTERISSLPVSSGTVLPDQSEYSKHPIKQATHIISLRTALNLTWALKKCCQGFISQTCYYSAAYKIKDQHAILITPNNYELQSETLKIHLLQKLRGAHEKGRELK